MQICTCKKEIKTIRCKSEANHKLLLFRSFRAKISDLKLPATTWRAGKLYQGDWATSSSLKKSVVASWTLNSLVNFTGLLLYNPAHWNIFFLFFSKARRDEPTRTTETTRHIFIFSTQTIRQKGATREIHFYSVCLPHCHINYSSIIYDYKFKPLIAIVTLPSSHFN